MRELLDGRILVSYRGEILLERPAPKADFILLPRSTRSEARRIARHDDVVTAVRKDKKPPRNKRGQLTNIRRPTKNHTWRKPYNPNLLPDRREARG